MTTTDPNREEGLAWAIAHMVGVRREPKRSGEPTVADVIEWAREQFTLDEIEDMAQAGEMPGGRVDPPILNADEAQGYRQVLAADAAAFTPEVLAEAAALLESFPSDLDGPAEGEDLYSSGDYPLDDCDVDDPLSRARDAVAALPGPAILAVAADGDTTDGRIAVDEGHYADEADTVGDGAEAMSE